MTEYKSKQNKIESVLTVTKAWANARSKDPSSKVGAAVFNPITGAIHLGYNGFPPRFPDHQKYWDNRDPEVGVTKHELVVHAEVNAIRKAWQAGEDTSKCVLICTHVPCPNCMRDVIAPAGITTVYYETYEYPSNTDRSEMVRDIIAVSMQINFIVIKEQ